MLLKGEYIAALTEVLIVAQSRFQIDALQGTTVLLLDMAYRLLREFRQASTRLDTPPFSNRRHPGSDIALRKLTFLGSECSLAFVPALGGNGCAEWFIQRPMANLSGWRTSTPSSNSVTRSSRSETSATRPGSSSDTASNRRPSFKPGSFHP